MHFKNFKTFKINAFHESAKFSLLVTGILLFSLVFVSCQQIEQWQEKYLAQRYGTSQDSQKQMEIWQKEAADYEKEMNAKIKAANRASAVYRSLANAFAAQESWYLCIENLQKAIDYGNNNNEALYDLATCQGNWARSKNWPLELTREAENTLLNILQQEPSSARARYQLALIYFYGFGQNSPYRVLNSILTIEQKDFQEKALELLRQAASIDKDNPRIFQLLAVVYATLGKREKAVDALNREIEILRQSDANNYQQNENYKQAIESLQRLGGQP